VGEYLLRVGRPRFAGFSGLVASSSPPARALLCCSSFLFPSHLRSDALPLVAECVYEEDRLTIIVGFLELRSARLKVMLAHSRFSPSAFSCPILSEDSRSISTTPIYKLAWLVELLLPLFIVPPAAIPVKILQIVHEASLCR
jgi:hypothetical protein